MSSHPSVGLKQVHTVLLLRWVLIIATSYLVLFSRPFGETPPSVALFVAAYLGSNVILTRMGRRIRSWQQLDVGVVLFDTLAVCIGLALSANAAVDFFPVYFLVVFVGALTERLRLVVAAAVLISVVHLSTLARFVNFNELVDHGYILRIPFLFVVALFFGYLVQDARSRQRAEKARARALRRTEVLSGVTHDLKNPLGTIQSLAGLLLEDHAGPLNQQQTDLVRRIHANARRVIQLSVNLLDAARINAGRLRLQRRPSNLSHIVEDAVALARTAGDLKGVALRYSADPNLPTIDIDGLQVGRVISNVVDNAIKYTPGGGTVDVSTRRAADHLLVEVRDNGPGIPANEISVLFEKYQRGATTGRIEGTGLGLFIVKAVMQAHGGTVEVDSTPGDGTMVRVCFPTARSDSEQARSATAPVPRPAGWGQFSTGVAGTS
jgi:signal transduction histidine kinase